MRKHAKKVGGHGKEHAAAREIAERSKPKIESTPGVETGTPILRRTIASELDGTAAFPSLRLKHPLAEIFDDALAQATRGKGDARHGRGRDSTDPANFLAQDWAAIAGRHGSAFLSGQAEKKLREALDLPHAERRSELLGVLVYVAMLVIHHDKAFRG